MSELLELPQEQRQIALWLLRRGEADTAQVAAQFSLEMEVALGLLLALLNQNLVVCEEHPPSASWRTKTATRRPCPVTHNLWNVLSD